MKVLILGYGQVGRVLADLLSKEEKVNQIFCGDLGIKKEENKGKISLRRADLSDQESLLAVLNQIKPDVVVNAALPRFNTAILDCCVKSGSNYLDAASFWETDKNPNSQSPYKVEQLDYHEAFKKAGIIGMINSGVSPGLTNLFAKKCSKDFDEMDYIKIRIIEETKANKAVFSWCKEWLIDEINSKPIAYSKNKFHYVEHAEEEEYDFPAPFGRKKVSYIAQDEVGTIPLYMNVKNVDIKAYDDQAELIKENLKSNKDGENGADIKSFEDARFGIAVEAFGDKDGRKKSVKFFVAFPKQKEINEMGLNANFITYPTALMMKAFIMVMGEIKDSKHQGVFPPEALNADIIASVLKDISKNGINIIKNESDVAEVKEFDQTEQKVN